LFNGVLSGPEVQQLEVAAESALRGLPKTVTTTVTCSDELCRITLQGAEGELEANAGRIIQQMPKKFAGTLLLPDGDGQRAVFAAMRQEVFASTSKPDSQTPAAAADDGSGL